MSFLTPFGNVVTHGTESDTLYLYDHCMGDEHSQVNFGYIPSDILESQDIRPSTSRWAS